MQYNDICRNDYGRKIKKDLAMQQLHNYVDICLIDEYANKDFENGYSLDLDDLSENERENFLKELMQHDTAVRDLVHYHMQKLIDERIPECEFRDFNSINLVRRASC